MSREGGCLFRIGYYFYSRTRIGKIYHNRDIAKARQKYPNGETHTVIQSKNFNDLSITPIPMLMDNYCYLVQDNKNNSSVVIDPGDPEPVLNYLSEKEIVPEAVLVTHKHWDHSGGNEEFKKTFKDIKIFGGKHDSVPDVNSTVDHGHTLEFGNLRFQVQFTPGHTVGHVVYILDGNPFSAPDSLFSGDVLFLGGCGRMFEGPSLTMLQSLDSLCKLNGNTLVWPGHEYASDNLDFANHLEPESAAAKAKYEWVLEQRKKRLCTSPSTIEEEKSYNPFLRTSEKSVLLALDMIESGTFQPPGDSVRADALWEIRKRKDTYKYKL